MMLNSPEIVDDNMVVAEYEEIAVVDDINDMSELVVENEDDDNMHYEDVHENNEYGGMPIDQYNDIVSFKRTNVVPESIISRNDRSAPSHWRARCKCFSMADDNETLLYYNSENAVNAVPKVVVKKGEVRKVLERVHELIGHLGQKRTQMVVLRKLYWRSVRQDVKTFIASCVFCAEKKLQGRKITKAPVDITSENFDISVMVRELTNGNTDRLEFHLIGYNEDEVREASYTRMTSYTFKETESHYRSRYASQPGAPIFRRQPYVKKHNNQSIGYIVPFHQRSRGVEPEFLELYGRDEYPHHSEMMYETVSEMDDGMMRPRDEEKRKVDHLPDAHPVTLCGTELSLKNFKTEDESVLDDSSTRAGPSSSSTMVDSSQKQRYIQKRMLEMNSDRERSSMRDYSNDRHSSPTPTTTAGLVKKRRKELPSIRGMSNRFSLAIGESDRIDNTEVNRSNPHLIEYPDPSSILRGDNLGLSPVIMAPSTNDEVCKLQIEALQRHIHLQKLHEKLLTEQYEASMRIPMTRYIQQEEEVQEEQLEVEHDLNVIDNHVYEEEEEVPTQNQRGHIRHQ
uniref:Integrase_H2C2 domain-containing protein n=1 Tax=Caenorhabditis tropicalis TaxID=1561998 RepID=A0A1I7T3F6_9PELO